MCPLVSIVVENATRKVLDRSPAIVRVQGGGDFVQGTAKPDIAKLQFATYEPIEPQKPVLGDWLRSASCARCGQHPP